MAFELLTESCFPRNTIILDVSCRIFFSDFFCHCAQDIRFPVILDTQKRTKNEASMKEKEQEGQRELVENNLLWG